MERLLTNRQRSRDIAVLVARLRGNGPWQWVILEPPQGWTTAARGLLRKMETGLQRYREQAVNRERQ
ncbi:hypothetical protein ACFV0R_30370 [Streptomyces sp. NPDC059578]|uniref:hypothetical protein n=1 Tax=Streptomyces sp. NPDC059578 TaxID=3346874 RepID=UPI0036CF63B3